MNREDPYVFEEISFHEETLETLTKRMLSSFPDNSIKFVDSPNLKPYFEGESAFGMIPVVFYYKSQNLVDKLLITSIVQDKKYKNQISFAKFTDPSP